MNDKEQAKTVTNALYPSLFISKSIETPYSVIISRIAIFVATKKERRKRERPRNK